MKTILPATVLRISGAFAGLTLLTLLNSPWPAAVAAPVTAKDAASAVMGWLSGDPTPLGETLGGTVQRVDTFNDQGGNPAYYIVYLDPSGFVIVSADDLVEPIVGFARAGQYDPSENNPLGALVSNDLPARLAYARQMSATSPDTNTLQAQAKWQQLDTKDGGSIITPKALTSVSDVRVAPFTQTTWDQQTAAGAGTTACYNYYTPPYGAGNVNNYPAGCVATAMAQLMRYYQFPSTSIGTASFPITVDGSGSSYSLRGGDGAGGPYVWSNMPLVPPDSPTITQCQAIGALVADAGATVKMSYTAPGSSSILTDAKTALVSTFHFGSAIKGWNGNSDIGAGLVGMINPNLDARYPVLLGIQGSTGHAVVADGYGYSASTLYHHLNLGWSGASTAWYALPLIDTANSQTFTVVDQCVYNAYTNGSGEIISGRVLDQISRPVANATVTATRTGGTYTTTTDTNGIYALARIASGTSYSITVTKANYTPVSTNLLTGTSVDSTASSGNRWGVNLTMSMLTTVLDHLVWSAIASTQALNTPFGVTITAKNVTNGLATGFTGTVALSGAATGVLSTNTVVGNLGASQTDTDYSYNWTYGYSFTPNTNIQVISVRTYSGSKVSIWTDTGTLLVEQSVASPPGTWTETALGTPITLSAGTTYRVSAYYPIGTTSYSTMYYGEWPTTFANGMVGQNYYYISTDGFPHSVAGTGIGPFLDLRYIVGYSNSVAVNPTTSGTFVNGVWSGNITVSQAITNVMLKADDGAGHVATSNPFTVSQAVVPNLVGADIGDPGAPGSLGVTNGVYTVRGSGEDVVGTADDFFFACLPLQGDGMIVARLVSMQPDNSQSEAGVMMRDGLDSGARQVFLGLDASTNMFLRRRLVADANSIQNAGIGTNVCWLRLMRMGNNFIGHVSSNGTNWNYAWATALVLPSQLEVGLAVTAHHYGFIATAQFDNLVVGATTPLPGAWPGTAPRIYVCLDVGTQAAMQNLGGFPVLVGGVVGDQLRTRCSINPAASFASWQSLGTVTNTLGVVTFLDSQALTNPMCFYRVQRIGP